MATTSIQWTESTWNPLAGCTEVSPGCTNCYAAIMAHRLAAMGQRKYSGTTRKLANGKVVWTDKINLDAASLTTPLQKKKPTIWFVNSMSDLFHKDVPDEYIDKVFAVMALCPQHTFQVLTKRAERMQQYLSDEFLHQRIHESIKQRMGYSHPGRPAINRGDLPLPGVWLGVSVEDQKRADERIPHLLKTPAAVRFLSCEPLLGPIQFRDVLGPKCEGEDVCHETAYFRGLDWVIIGGESGHGARPFIMDWGVSIIQQCKQADVPVFMKQVGSNPFINKDLSALGVSTTIWGPIRDSKGGKMEEWPLDLRVRQFPETAAIK